MAEAVLNINNDILDLLGHMKIGEESPGTNKATLVAPSPPPPPMEYISPKQRGPLDENQLQSSRQLRQELRRRKYLQRQHEHHQTIITPTSTSSSTGTNDLSPYHSTNYNIDNNQFTKPGHCTDFTNQKDINNSYSTNTGPCPNITNQDNTVNTNDDNGQCLHLANHSNTATPDDTAIHACTADPHGDYNSNKNNYFDPSDFSCILARFHFYPSELSHIADVLGTINMMQGQDFDTLARALTHEYDKGPHLMNLHAICKIEYIYYLTKYKHWQYDQLDQHNFDDNIFIDDVLKWRKE